MAHRISQLTATIFILLGVALSVHAQSPCVPGDAAREAILPLALQYKLLAHKIPGDDSELDAPPEVGRNVVMLRKALDIATQAFFRCEVGDDPNPASLQSKLADFLHTDRSKRDPNSSATDGVYGANLSVHIEPAQEFPNSLFVVLTFGIECGDDNLLFLYAKKDGHWHQRLQWYSDKYTQPSDAFGDIYFFDAVPGRLVGQPLLAIAHGHPWCTSVYSGFNLDLLRPATASSPQEVLDHITDGYVRDGNPRMKRTANGLQLHIQVTSKDTNILYHPGILRYTTTTDKLTLLPVARNARDFVDAWLQEPWNTVATWSDSPNLQDLHGVHNKFDYSLHKNYDEVPGLTFGPVRGCTNHFQIELDLWDSKGASIPSLYAQVRQNSNSFTMLAITPVSDPTCAGPDLMRKH